ncbi:M16 family metallopeptidase [Leptothoe spongobia]|uniref:Insulinase family protein n=1 Tax=Leptothoe spongobia TAU-MAC 1115 TaxID=1967444 RepID=A0A947DIL9_9CYAN|nr:pitrilysin family protein [Leptothoe spongobia]MBT9317917.1 insulinase family protein [Leptothoe spongobia TAU-MAC 1115]
MGVTPLARPKIRLLWAIVLTLFLWLGVSEPAWAQVFGKLDRQIEGSSTLAVAEDGSTIQPYLDRVANDVSEFTLDNGMKFIVLERHQAPVVSMMLYAKVGAVNEVDGYTGVAHYLEHLAFKGTTNIGTTDYAAEAPLLEEMDAVFGQLMAAEKVGDDEQLAALHAQFDTLQAQASGYVEQNKFGQIIEQSGGRGLNATTSADATRYFYSLPSNKLELWMSLESARFLDPVFREFYKEKEVILEERRMRVDNSPIGQIVEKFLEVAFDEHPYRRPVIGYKEDLRTATRADIAEFFDAYYGPSNLVAAVVGDVDPENVKALAKAYFGRSKARSLPPDVTIEEPVQTQEKFFELTLPSQPWYLEGFHRPGINHPDHVVYSMIESILVGGRTSRMYQDLVEQSQVALNIGSANGFPGDLYDNILLLYGLTAPGHTVDEMALRMEALLTQLKEESVTPEELERVKTQARAGMLRSLDSNSGMASLLTEYEAKTDDWRNVFEELKAIEAVTAEDVQRVAQATFVPSNRTVGKLLSAEP